MLHWIIGGEFLPSPYQVYLEAVRMFSIKIGGNTVWMHIYYSLRRVILAYLEIVAAQDCVCLAVAHSTFDLPWILKRSRLVMDATGATRQVAPVGGTLIRL